MANKRELKKYINRAVNDIAFACFITECSVSDADSKQFNKILVELSTLKNQALKAVSFAFDKSAKSFESKKAYNTAKRHYNTEAYAAFKNEFGTRLQKIVDELNELLPKADQK